jgi:hypothetical protein
VREALALLGLFWAQFLIGAVVPTSADGVELLILSAAYLVAGLYLIVRRLGVWRQRLRDGFRTPYEVLESDEPISEAETRG